MRPGLLVSVRSVVEARSALAGGVDLVDVKEPSRGPLGAADLDVIENIIAEVAGRTPVSAALGEWNEWTPRVLPAGLAYAKWGMSRTSVNAIAGIRQFRDAKPVLVAYADFDRAASPAIDVLVDAACDLRFPAFLIDTAIKDGAGLLEWTSMTQLERVRRRLLNAQVRFALAGSLDLTTIQKLAYLEPDWFAVRGAACEGGREGTVTTNRVKQLKSILESPQTSAAAS
jgi:uncharacterized protein (UPF0264 family)